MKPWAIWTLVGVGMLAVLGVATMIIVRPKAEERITPPEARATVPVPSRAIQAAATQPQLPATKATAEVVAPQPTELELLRAENLKLKGERDALANQNDKLKALIPPPPPPTPAPPATISVTGSAYVVRNGEQSDILRGFHIALLPSNISADVWRAALDRAISNFRSDAKSDHAKAAESRSTFASLRSSSYDPGEFDEKQANTEDEKANELAAMLAQVSGAIDTGEALHVLKNTGYVNAINAMVDACAISRTTTDVQGSYKFANAPVGSKVYAMFDTRDGFLVWAIQVKTGQQFDLFNDSALP